MNSNPSGIDRIYPRLDDLAELLNFPGWLVVMLFDPRQSPKPLANSMTDALIPTVSAFSWTLLAYLFVKLWKFLHRYVHARANSR